MSTRDTTSAPSFYVFQNTSAQNGPKKRIISEARARSQILQHYTKFVVNKAKLANTEYGRLVNVKNDWDRNKPKSYGKPTKNVAAYQVSSRHQNEEQDGKRNPVMKSTCIFCSKDGHSLSRCFMFQEKSHAERKRFVREKGLCNLCMSKRHFVSKCQRGRVSLMDAVDDIIHCFILPN